MINFQINKYVENYKCHLRIPVNNNTLQTQTLFGDSGRCFCLEDAMYYNDTCKTIIMTIV